MKAIWQDTVIAESDDTVVVEGNHYFPADTLVSRYFEASDHTTECGWKGTASYLNVIVGSQRNQNAAWFYASPKEAAAEISGRVAFWQGVEVVE